MTKKMFTSMLVLFTVVVTVAKADHSGGGGFIGELVQESEELDQLVRYAPMNYQVKRTVSQFANDVRRLAECVQFNPLDDHGVNPGGIPQQCGYQLNVARNSFGYVTRYLYDTNYDFPQIYQTFLSVQRALNIVCGGGGGGGPVPHPHPGPGPNPFPGGPQTVRCTANDSGWEEHFGGHVGFGRNAYEAQTMALRECQRFHGRCTIRNCQ